MKTQAGIRIIPSKDDLLEVLSLELQQFSAEELQDVLVILPTQRLGQYLLTLLGVHKQTFLAPTLLTLETFIQQQIPHALQDMTILSPSAEELLLASIIKQTPFKHIQKGHEHEIREFFSQLHQAEIGESAFDSLKTLIQKDIYRDEAHIGSLVERVAELQILFKHYASVLHSKKALSSEQLDIACVHNVLKTWQNVENLPWRWVFLAGFTTSKAYCRPMLKLFSQKANVSLLFTEAPKLLGHHSPLRELLEAILERPIEASQSELPLVLERTQILATQTLVSESQEAIATIRQYLDQGCPESRIGLLVSDEKSYGKILATLLEKESFKTNLAIAQPFAETMIGSWLVSLLKYLVTLRSSAPSKEKAKEASHLLQEFLRHPLSWEALAPDSSMESFLCIQYDLAMGEEDSTFALLSALNQKLAPCAKLMQKHQTESLANWQTALMQVIAKFGFLEESNDPTQLESKSAKREFKRADLEAFKKFCDFFNQWSLVWDKKVSGSECIFALLDKIQSLETRSVGFPLEGVQVLDIIEARYVPFEVLIVLGCTEGRFPRSLPNDRLISDLLKVKLGMPGWQYIEALEDTTFHLLCNQAQYFTFLYSVSPDYGSLCRSRFIERILAQDKGSFRERPMRILGAREVDLTKSLALQKTLVCDSSLALGMTKDTLAMTELNDIIGKRGDFQGERLPLFEEISASSLSQLFRCPYQFLLSKLGVKAKEEESSSLWEGRWLHEILEAFYTGQLQTRQVIEPLPAKLVLRESEIIPYALERLHKLTEQCLPDAVKGSPFHLHVLHFSWPRFAQYWSKFFEHQAGETYVLSTTDSLKEFALAGKGLPLDRPNDRWASLLGTLDSLDLLPKSSVLIDYKRKNVDPMSEIIEGLSPQLPLYALAMAQNRFHADPTFLEKCLVGYWSLVAGRWQACGVGENVRPWALAKKLISPQTPPLSQLIQKLQSRWDYAIQTLFQAKQAFAPVQSAACEFCAFTGICRKDDPVYAQLIEEATLESLNIEESESEIL